MQNQIQAAEDAVRGRDTAVSRDRPRSPSDYLILQQRLRDLQILKATATGNFRVLVPATIPEEPISPKPVRNALLGLRGRPARSASALPSCSSRSTRGCARPDDVAAMLHQPILARIPRLSREQQKSRTLVTLAHPADPASEAFRVLRSNLGFMDVDRNAKTLMVTSSMQGEGKSVLVANLAVTLALAGKKVIVVDADLRRPRQHRLFDLQRRRRKYRHHRRFRDRADAAARRRPAAGWRGGPDRLRRLGRRQAFRHSPVGAHQRPHPAQSGGNRRLATVRADSRQAAG